MDLFKKAHKKLLSSLFYFRKTNDLFEQILFALNDDLSEQATAFRFLRNEPLRAPELEMLAPVIIKNLLNKIVII